MSEATFNVIIGGAVSAFVTLMVQVFQLVMQQKQRKKQMAFKLWEKRAETYEKTFKILNMERFVQAVRENADDLPFYFKKLIDNISDSLGANAIFASRDFNNGVSRLIGLISPATDSGSPIFSDSSARDVFLKDFAKECSNLREIARKEFKADKAVSYL